MKGIHEKYYQYLGMINGQYVFRSKVSGKRRKIEHIITPEAKMLCEDGSIIRFNPTSEEVSNISFDMIFDKKVRS